MSLAREKRDSKVEENKFSSTIEELLEKYRPVFEEIGNVVIASITADDSDCENECSCEDCCDRSCDPIGDRVSRRSLEAIAEIVNRWAEDPNYSSDDAMDAVSNVIERLGD